MLKDLWLIPACLLNNLSRVIKTVEGGHQVDTSRAFFQLINQFDRETDAFLGDFFSSRQPPQCRPVWNSFSFPLNYFKCFLKIGDTVWICRSYRTTAYRPLYNQGTDM